MDEAEELVFDLPDVVASGDDSGDLGDDVVVFLDW